MQQQDVRNPATSAAAPPATTPASHTTAGNASNNSSTTVGSSAGTSAAGPLQPLPPLTKLDGVPDFFICPITLEIMNEPTISKCGHMFERTAIVKWMKGEYDPTRTTYSRSCPVCHQPIDEEALSPCYPLRTAIHDWVKGQMAAKEELSPKEGNKKSFFSFKLGARRNSGSGSGSTLPRSQMQQSDTQSQKPKYNLPFFGLAQTSSAPTDVDSDVGGTSTAQLTVGATSTQATREADTGNGGGTSPRDPMADFGQMRRALPEDETPSSGSALADSPIVPVWAILEHIIDPSQSLELNREKFLIGRHVSCHGRITQSEISSRHVYMWREQRPDGLWDAFLEDRSTNGTFINGRTVGKKQRRIVRHGDEISLGRRFTSNKELPEIRSYIEWLFVGTQAVVDHRADVDAAKTIENFVTLLRMTDEEMIQHGIQAEPVRALLRSTINSWLYEHRFPSFRLVLVERNLYAPDVAVLPMTDNAQQQSPLPRAIAPPPLPAGNPAIPVPLSAPVMDVSFLQLTSARLAVLFPSIDREVVALAVSYERMVNPQLSAQEIELKAMMKLHDIQARQSLTQQMPPVPTAVLAAPPAANSPQKQGALNAPVLPTSILGPLATLPQPAGHQIQYIVQPGPNGQNILIPVLVQAPTATATPVATATNNPTAATPEADRTQSPDPPPSPSPAEPKAVAHSS